MDAISESITCPPAPVVLNIRQFLCKKLNCGGWNEQQWLEAYSQALQHMEEVEAGRCWDPLGKGFAPHVSSQVEAFWSMTGMQVTGSYTIDCWGPPVYIVPCEKDSGSYAKVISYLDEVAMH